MDGLHVLWIGDHGPLAESCGEAISRSGGWWARVSTSDLPMRLERARRSIAAAVIDLRGASDVDATRDSIVLLRAHSPGIAIVVCTDGTPIDSVDLVVVGREQNHVDAVVRGIAQQIDEARLTRFDGDVRLAIDHVLSVPHRKLAPRARAAVLLRTLQLVGKSWFMN